MGCTTSQPTGPDPVGNTAKSAGTANGNNGKKVQGETDGLSNASSRRRGQSKEIPTNSGLAGITTNNKQKGSRHNRFQRKDSIGKDHGSSGSHLTFGNKSAKLNGTGNGFGNAEMAATDPRWIKLWKSHLPLLLDPADIHSTIEAAMSRATNQLSAAEITFLQRKVRSVVRTSNLFQEKATFNLLRNNSQEQETKSLAEKHHLLSNHVIRKVLPKPLYVQPPDLNQDNENTIVVGDNVYILLLYLHESLWDRVAEIAASTAKEAGLEMDVNKCHLPDEVPPPVLPTLDSSPDVPLGVSFHALSFLIGLALRGSRMQRLQLLFYLMLPPNSLNSFLEHHCAGGVPVWLLEMGNVAIMSVASLAHYYWHGDVFSPVNDGLAHEQSDNAESSSPLHDSHLVVDGPQVQALFLEILSSSSRVATQEQNPDKKPLHSPVARKGSLGLRRRFSNQASDEDMSALMAQTEVMERLPDSRFLVEDFVANEETTLEAYKNAPTLKDAATIRDFFEFCQTAIDDEALDSIMQRFFAHTVLPSPHLEFDLVKKRWQEWQEAEGALWSTSSEQPQGTLEQLANSVREVVDNEYHDPETKPVQPSRRAFGGLGGYDGFGGLGYGVMYCVDKEWWTSWEAYVGWSWVGENYPSNTNHTRKSRLRPSSLSAERLLSKADDTMVPGTSGSYELMKADLQKDKDYVLVPPGVWDVLYEMYGGGPPLPRMVVPPYSSANAKDQDSTNRSGISAGGASSQGTTPSERDLDAMATTENHDRAMRVPPQMEVASHPWILQVLLCDPQQPYRRGDAGQMSIRVMVTADQPLWRVISEIVARLPFHLFRSYGPDGRGMVRLWKRTDPSTLKQPMARYGPWALLCKNRHATLPPSTSVEETQVNLEELKEDWVAFTDNSSVDSIELSDGDQLMVECAVVNRSGDFVWPREQAAKAGRERRLADNEVKFRRLLRGLDEHGKPLAKPVELVGMAVDASDTSGRWYKVNISKVQTVTADTDEEEDSTELEGSEGYRSGSDGRKGGGESKQVLVDFSEHGGHAEWIEVESDRLATAGRFTLGKNDEAPEAPQKKPTGANADNKPKGTQVKKATDTEASGKICTIPGYGACGLANLGNTCYANAAVQCVSYLPLLRAYLLSAQYKSTGDLNKDNPIGTGGKLLEEFADLLKLMWSAKWGEKSPQKFRNALGKTNEQFSGADQQDSQEFLSFILDVLHEDSNRVRKKPIVEGLEDDWVKKTSLVRVGEEAWRRFLRRNRSVMADVGMGQVLNTVTCPKCGFSSRNFDPFNLVSLPFPTVADVIFKVVVVRRANAYNTPWVLNHPRKGGKWRTRFVKRDLIPRPQPPSEQLIKEQYIIAMSRLADSGDLKLQIQNLTGIPLAQLRLGKAEEVLTKEKDNSVVRSHTQVTLLGDKDCPCSQLVSKQKAKTDDITTPAAPTLILAFESTIRQRPVDTKSSDDESSDSKTEEGQEEKAEKTTELSKEELKEVEKDIAVYGNPEECRLYDTGTVPIAKAMSRSLWPRTEDDLKLGLRVDAIDSQGHWFPGSVVRIGNDEDEAASKDSESEKKIVQVHFDNFASRWDEKYTIDDFSSGRVRPLYAHASPRAKRTELAVHHRHTDRNTRASNLFGQSFYVQCHNEWSNARAGAQILAQASRFLKQPPESGAPNTLDDSDAAERELKVQRLYDRTQGIISDLIDLLVDYDRDYVRYALWVAQDANAKADSAAERFRNPAFDPSEITQSLQKRLGTMLVRLPFEIRVCTLDNPLGGNEEMAFPFSLMRTIGNYMNARHVLVLQWREPPSDKKATGRNTNYLGAPVLYTAPKIAIDESSAKILDKANQKAKRSSTSHGSGGLQLGVCLTEFCKEQQLSSWRCPRCKDFREGKQNMVFWRLPDLLTIHIKRFNCSARWREKITTKVNFPLTGLDLQEWCHEESPVVMEDSAGETFVYDLVGVLNHYGGMTGGHYVAACRATGCGREGKEEVAYGFNGVGVASQTIPEDMDQDVQTGWKFGRQKTEANQSRATAASTTKAAADSGEPLWLQFDDELVEPIPPRDVVSEMAYVLFYRRRRMTPSNIAKYSTLV